MKRRDVMKALVGGAAGVASARLLGGPLGRALAATKETDAADELFLFIHASGGWDVTLWADPRNEKRGLVEPAATDNTDTAPIRQWVDQPLDEGRRTFKIVQPAGCRIPFGPGIGRLVEHADRLCVVNGLEMNTVSHPDGTTFSATGRHLEGGRAVQASVNTALAAELGVGQTFPSVSVQFPSAFAEGVDQRAAPLVVERIGNISRTLARASLYDGEADRAAVTALLSDEAGELARRSSAPEAPAGLALQYASLQRMLSGDLVDVFSEERLRAAQPQLDYKARFAAQGAVNAAFAVEAMKRNLVRCVSFSVGGFDTHGQNYRQQAQVQQETFDLVAALLEALDRAPHPTRTGAKLSEHTHLLVFSDFCRTPQLNLANGRDHYPNNSALIVSPRFRGNSLFGRTDGEQLLPVAWRRFRDRERPMAPPDLLATFLAAFGVRPERWLRDGEVVPELLRA